MSSAPTGWSADGNWFWDGAKWNDALSADTRWRFDGKDWQPFSGLRTPMPAQPPSAAAPPPPAAPGAVAAPLPSWVDPSEVDRLEGEKREREAAALAPPAPLPPEADWRLVGERMQHSDYSHNVNYASWRVGTTSILIYILLLWLCGPLSAIFVWMTGWSLTSKVITTFISLIGLIIVLFLVFAAHVLPTTTG